MDGKQLINMKYFDYECCYENPDELFNQQRDQYNFYIDSIYWKLSFPFKLLTKHIGLHDAIIRKIHWQQPTSTIRLTLDCGDSQIGYFQLQLFYKQIHPSMDKKIVNKFSKAESTEINRNEIEILDNGYISHKMIFFSKKEIEVISKDLYLEISRISPNYANIPIEILIT